MNYQNFNNFSPSSSVTSSQVSTFISKVYLWMCLALSITAVASYLFASSPSLKRLVFSQEGPTFLFWALIIGQLLLVISLNAAIQKMTSSLATAVFLFYSFINGITLCMIFMRYTTSSIATTFFVTAGIFGIMSAYGYFTKKDLTKFGRIAFMALIGIILASIVNYFMQSGALNFVISIIGVLVFVGLIAYDTQKLKAIAESSNGDAELLQKYSLIGALALYLDFVNLFLFLLRFLGNRK